MVKTYQVDMIIQKPIHPEMFVQQIAELFELRDDKSRLAELEAELERESASRFAFRSKRRSHQ